jgi:hypothetical protein
VFGTKKILSLDENSLYLIDISPQRFDSVQVIN